jgi:hypothetical protein
MNLKITALGRIQDVRAMNRQERGRVGVREPARRANVFSANDGPWDTAASSPGRDHPRPVTGSLQ